MVDPRELADELVQAIPDRDAIAFAYGQGSAFTQFARPSDIDLVVVWPAIPARDRRIGTEADKQFEGADFALDKLCTPQVDVMHLSLASFTSWCESVEQGHGWRDETWPQPLHVIAGFVQGQLLRDETGEAARWLDRLRVPAEPFVTTVLASLAAELDDYLTELRACARRGDHWLFGRLIDRLVRHCYIAWVGAEGHYCPFPKHLHEWIHRLTLDPHLAALEATIWAAPTLEDRANAAEAFARKVTTLRAQAVRRR